MDAPKKENKVMTMEKKMQAEAPVKLRVRSLEGNTGFEIKNLSDRPLDVDFPEAASTRVPPGMRLELKHSWHVRDLLVGAKFKGEMPPDLQEEVDRLLAAKGIIDTEFLAWKGKDGTVWVYNTGIEDLVVGIADCEPLKIPKGRIGRFVMIPVTG